MIDLEEFALFDSKSGVEEDASDGEFIKVVLPADAGSDPNLFNNGLDLLLKGGIGSNKICKISVFPFTLAS